MLFFFSAHADPRDLHSFPTRRSSDLIVMWTVDTVGWKGATADEIVQRSLELAEPGAIYVMHVGRSEEHTSELQSRVDLVCRLLLEKKKKKRRSDRVRRGGERRQRPAGTPRCRRLRPDSVCPHRA